MSGTPPAAGVAANDPSMEDILASIRRILSEDEAPAAGHAAPANAMHNAVLQLDESMMVAPPAAEQAEPAAPEPVPVAPVVAAGPLLAPEAAQAATDSVGTLLRRLVADREQVVVHRGGPTIEDMVREELRPLLKAWLDANLPELVERHVRVEIERVVGRAIP